MSPERIRDDNGPRKILPWSAPPGRGHDASPDQHGAVGTVDPSQAAEESACRSIPDRYRFATRLNSFRDRGVDRGATAPDLLRTVARVPGLTAVELNYPQHFRERPRQR